ncbi:gp385 [Bacillus phage G]|uniref:Gp385 n=1 Tax=Bacillus phage G TaxID=2884420 RepID=G3MAC6_9CAUD|nr:gp385 [Bacillus phage G]AEO93644.1 gp385 [Bacillus phage G]
MSNEFEQLVIVTSITSDLEAKINENTILSDNDVVFIRVPQNIFDYAFAAQLYSALNKSLRGRIIIVPDMDINVMGTRELIELRTLIDSKIKSQQS